MKKLSLEDLLSSSDYEQQRPAFRTAMLEHKKNRRLHLGPNTTLHFEDYMTMKYQVQELMRVEKISAADDITEELDAYNPLIPDGMNLKATFMIEFPDANERQIQLGKLINIESTVSIVIDGCAPVRPIADEDLERATEAKTSAVHFLRFEFDGETIAAVKRGAKWAVVCEHTDYSHRVDPVPENIRTSLSKDFD